MLSLAVFVLLLTVVLPMAMMLGSAYLLVASAEPNSGLRRRLRGLRAGAVVRRESVDLDREYEILTRRSETR